MAILRSTRSWFTTYYKQLELYSSITSVIYINQLFCFLLNWYVDVVVFHMYYDILSRINDITDRSLSFITSINLIEIFEGT